MATNSVYPQTLYDLYNDMGQDLILNPDSDLLNVSNTERSKQRVLRRLLTNPIDYIWHIDYGAGLPSYVGREYSNATFNDIQSAIISNIFNEDSVAKIPAPEIIFQTIPQGLVVQISYTVNPYGQPVVLNFMVDGL